MRDRKTIKRVAVPAAACLLAASSVAFAQEKEERLGVSFELGAERSDNILRSNSDEQTETIALAILGLDIATDRRRVDARLSTDLQYRDYLDTELESEIAGGAIGYLDLSFIPERFSWITEDNYGQIAKTRQVVDRPDNRQQMNYFTTGPDFRLPLGQRAALQLSGRWADTYMEDSNADNEATFADISLFRQLTDRSSISIGAGTSETEFDDPTFPNFKTRQATAGFRWQAPRTSVALDGGYLEYDQEGAPDVSDFVMVRVDLTRQVTARSRVQVNAGTKPSSDGESFRRDQSIIGIGDGPEAAQASGDFFRVDDAYVLWTTDWERTALSWVASFRREEHEVFNTLDREQLRGQIGLSRELSPSIDLEVMGGYLQEERTLTGFQFDDWYAATELKWDFARRFSAKLRLDHFVGGSDDGTRDYTENRVYLGVAYTNGR